MLLSLFDMLLELLVAALLCISEEAFQPRKRLLGQRSVQCPTIDGRQLQNRSSQIFCFYILGDRWIVIALYDPIQRVIDLQSLAKTFVECRDLFQMLKVILRRLGSHLLSQRLQRVRKVALQQVKIDSIAIGLDLSHNGLDGGAHLFEARIVHPEHDIELASYLATSCFGDLI